MRLFNDIHRSITDKRFFSEVTRFSVRRISLYVAILVGCSGLANGAAHLALLGNSRHGIAQTLPAVLPGGIRNGRLEIDEPQPYTPNPVFLTHLISQLYYTNIGAIALPDSFLIVDTRTKSGDPSSIGKHTAVHLTADTLFFRFGDGMVSFAYKWFTGGADRAEINSESIDRFLREKRLALLVWLSLAHGVKNAGNAFAAILFVGIAAFIFRKGEKKRIDESLKIAAYAITPFSLISIAGALAGVRAEWLWHVSMFLSTALVLRAFYQSPKSDTRNPPGEKQ